MLVKKTILDKIKTLKEEETGRIKIQAEIILLFEGIKRNEIQVVFEDNQWYEQAVLSDDEDQKWLVISGETEKEKKEWQIVFEQQVYPKVKHLLEKYKNIEIQKHIKLEEKATS